MVYGTNKNGDWEFSQSDMELCFLGEIILKILCLEHMLRLFFLINPIILKECLHCLKKDLNWI